MVRFAWGWGALGALACSAVWAVSPPVTGDVCINQGPTRECILPTPVVPLKPQVPPAQTEGNMLVNGSFEQPALSVGDWQVHQAIPGWVTVDGPGIELQHRAAGAPHHGNQLAELDSHGNSAIVQAVSVVPGQTYELRFWTMARPRTPTQSNGLDVFVNDTRIHRVRHSSVPAELPVHDMHPMPLHLPMPSAGLSVRAPLFEEVHLRWTAGPDVNVAVLRFEASGCSDSLGSYLDTVSWRAVGRD